VRGFDKVEAGALEFGFYLRSVKFVAIGLFNHPVSTTSSIASVRFMSSLESTTRRFGGRLCVVGALAAFALPYPPALPLGFPASSGAELFAFVFAAFSRAAPALTKAKSIATRGEIVRPLVAQMTARRSSVVRRHRAHETGRSGST
jgi:hypothetical protein